MLQFKSGGYLLRFLSCSGEASVLFYWLNKAHYTMTFFYSESTNVNVNCLQNVLKETFKIMFEQISGPCDPENLTKLTIVII